MMKSLRQLLPAAIFLLPFNNTKAQVLVGDAGLSAAPVWYSHLFIDSTDTPSIFYGYQADMDMGVPDRLNIERLDTVSNTWQFKVVPNYIEWHHTAVGFDRAATPYYLFQENFSPVETEIRKMTGYGTHTIVGTPVPEVFYLAAASIESDHQDTMFICYESYTTGLHIMKFDGTDWQEIGNATSFDANVPEYQNFHLRFDRNDVPYVAFSDADHGNRLSVIKYNGSTWEYIGSPGFNGISYCYNADIVFDSNNNPYVLGTYGSHSAVHKLVSGEWVTIGHFTDYASHKSEIAISTNDLPLIVYGSEDVDFEGYSYLMQYTGSSWDIVDTLPEELSMVNLNIAIDSKNTVYVAGGALDISVYKYQLCSSTMLSITGNVIHELTGNDGAIDLTISGAIGSYTLAWNTGATTEDLVSLPSGIYSVTVTDSVGNCQVKGFSVNTALPMAVIKGKVYADLNLDCVQDLGEEGLSNGLVKIDGTSTYYAVSNSMGDYTAFVPAGSYNVSAEGPYTLAACALSPVTVNPAGADTSEIDFAADVTSTLDIRVDVVPHGIAPGFTRNMIVRVSNHVPSAIPLSGTVYFVMPDTLTYNFATPTPDATSGDTLFWNYSGLTGSGHINFGINYTCYNDVALIGTTVQLCGGVSTVSGTDVNLSNNTLCLETEITGSIDPNDKSVSPVGEDADGKIPVTENEFTYLIRFQNTGTDTAHNVFITDTLSHLLDPASVQVTAASHNYLLNIVNGNVLKFKFDNIMLPDSNVNEAASHGFVQFKIKTDATPVVGTAINNTANIYFDFNPAVVTNTTVNTYFDWTGVGEMFAGNNIELYPNPVTSQVMMVNKTANVMAASIVDISGKQVRSLVLQPGSNGYDVSSLGKGLYFVKIDGASLKLVKQ